MHALLDRLTMARSRLRLPRRTVRIRLTALYSGLSLLAGAVLLTITYLLVDRSTSATLFVSRNGGAVIAKSSSGATQPRITDGTATASQLHLARQLLAQSNATHSHDLHQLLVQSIIALAIMAVLAVALGWLMAGRVIRPLRTMAGTTQRITERNLHERLALSGPSDEVKDLADTIDDLLGRLETAFRAQRHFVANASHELRTPLTLDRTLIDVALADSHADADDLRETLQELLASGERQERLIDALLTLASSERGLDRHDTIDLAAMVERVVAMHRPDIDAKGLATDTTFGLASVSGNVELVERLVDNLVDNAIRHNVPDGFIEVTTGMDDGNAIVIVANSGPTVPREAVDRLFQPFERLDGDRSIHPDGHGLGLTIVRAIAEAHGAGLKVQLRPEGGLRMEVHLLPPHAGSGSSRAYEAQDERTRRSPIVKKRARMGGKCSGAGGVGGHPGVAFE